MSLQGAGFRWAFGSLANGTAVPALKPDQLTLARNIEHAAQGSVTKRPGMRRRFGVGDVAEASVAPVLSDNGAASSSLGNGTLYVRLTYSTVAGETDDLHSTQASIVTVSGNSYRCWFQFHIFSQRVLRHEQADNTLTLSDQFTTDWLSTMANDTFNGWYLYSRDPEIQDESGLGINSRNKKLWDRTNYLAKILDYASGVFTLDRGLPASLDGTLVDILMPDRDCLPIRAVNVYVSSNGTDFYFYQSHSPVLGTSEGRPSYVDITSIPTSNRRAPSTRVTRTAPTLESVDVTDTNPQTGIVTTVDSGIKGGLYMVRYAWETTLPSILDSTGWPEHEDFPLQMRDRVASQYCWPSKATLIPIEEGQGIKVTPPTRPSGCERYHVYAKKLTPSTTLTFASITNPSSTHRAYYHPMDVAAPVTNTTAGAGLWYTGSPSYFRSSSKTLEYKTSDTTFGATVQIISAAYDNVESADGNVARSQRYQVSGIGTTSFAKHQWEFQLSGGQQSSTTNCCFVIRFKCAKNSTYLNEAFVTPTDVPPVVKVRRWDNNGSAWIQLGNDIKEENQKTYRFAFAFDSNDLESGRMVFDAYGLHGFEPEVDYVALELYTDTVATDPTPTSTELWQDCSSETYLTLDCPLTTSNTGLSIRRNTTGQWPATVYSNPVQNYAGGPDTVHQNLVGCADSVFVESDGALDRIYQQDREDGCPSKASIAVCSHDWQFASWLSRTFFCNPGNDLDYNFRFDGIQTHGWGLAVPQPNGDAVADPNDEPTDGEEEGNDCSRFTVKEQWSNEGNPTGEGKWQPGNVYGGGVGTGLNDAGYPRWIVYDPEGGKHLIYDYRKLTDDGPINEVTIAGSYGLNDKIGTVWEGSEFVRLTSRTGTIRPVDTPYTEDIIECLTGTADPPEESPAEPGEGIPEGDYDFYLVEVRKLELPSADGRGYIVRSAPGFVDTVSTTADAKVSLTVAPPLDPQVTHVELYRNLKGTADYFSVGDPVEVKKANLTDGKFLFEDQTKDSVLADGALINFETGRPWPCRLVALHKNRIWFVPNFNNSAVCFTNLTSLSGDVDPEGWYALSSIVPTMKRQGTITALAPYADSLVCFSDSGVSQINGISADLNSANPISSTGLFAEAGAVGPSAWTEQDGMLFFMSRIGPAVLSGMSVEYIGDLVEGSVDTMNMGSNATRFMRVLHRRGRGISQVWYTYSDRHDGRPDKALIFNTATAAAASEESRKLWADWTELYAHSGCRSKSVDGVELFYLGDHWGNVHEFGALDSDNGRFIDAEIKTSPQAYAGAAKSFRPRRLILMAKGKSGDYINLDLYKDFGGTRRNVRLIRIDQQGDETPLWGEPGSQWGGSNEPGEWGGGAGTGYRAHGVHLGGVYHHLQFHLSQVWDDMPPGIRRNAGFEMAGYDITMQAEGFRRREP